MKRYWHSWMAVIVTVAMISPAAAQNDTGQLSEIGSYQSILSRAGYPTNGYGARPGRAAYTTPTTSVSNGDFYTQDAPVDQSVAPKVDPGAAVPEAPATALPDAMSSADAGVASVGISDCVTGNCGVGQPAGNGSNFVVGISGLIFDRDYEGHRSVSQNAAGGRLYTTDADHDNFGGVDVSLQRRNCNNRGWEARYWGLYPDTATSSLTGTPVYVSSDWRGLDQINHVASGANVWDIFQQGDVQTVFRDTNIQNIEFNLLGNAGCFTSRHGRQANVEVMAGFRWFEFDETLGFSSDSTFGAYPATLLYGSEVDNTLLGFQMGGSTEYCLTNRWRLSAGTKMGIYNNRINARQYILDDLGAYAQIGSGANAGDDYNLSDQKDDLAFLGELELGLIFQLSSKSRAVVGYRAVGVSGVALADGQIPYDYTDVWQITRTRSDNALLLHGGYAGLEFCY